jgi:copper chaperone CopZ
MQRRSFRWARQRTEDINDATAYLADIADNVTGGGGMGGGGGGGILGDGILSGAAGRIGGTLGGGLGGGLAGGSLAGLLKKVPLKSLLKKTPAFATLVKAADLGSELIKGDLSASDIISAPIEVGEMLTFGALDNDVIEGAIGTVTLGIGAVQIAGGLSSLLPSIGIGSILGGLGSGGALAGLLTAGGAASIGALVGGTISLVDVIDGDMSNWNFPARFGKAVGEEVRKNFPDIADIIETGFTNNPIFDFGSQVGNLFRSFTGDFEGQTEEEAIIGSQNTVVPIGMTGSQQVGEGSPAEFDADDTITNATININEQETVNVDGATVSREELKQAMEDAGWSPDKIERRLDQIERATQSRGRGR